MTASQRILVVDDDPSVLELVARALTEAGMEVRTARRAAVARAILARENFDLVLTDARMPGETGLEFAAMTRSLGIATIVMSGEPEWTEAHGLKAPHYLAKPFDIAGLLAAVRSPAAARDGNAVPGPVQGGRPPIRPPAC